MDVLFDKIIKKTRVVDCNLETAWWKWTTHEGLLTFFGADNKIELNLRGAYEIYFLMDNPPGLRGGEGNKVISFLPMRMLSFTWNAPPQYPEVRNHEHRTWVVLEFKTLENGKTEVMLGHFGWPAGELWDEVYCYFVSAWETVMDTFQDTVKV